MSAERSIALTHMGHASHANSQAEGLQGIFEDDVRIMADDVQDNRRWQDDAHSMGMEDGNVREQSTLPKADSGKEAWLFLAGSFMVEGLVWGFPFSFGVFQEYYTANPLFAGQTSGIAVIGTSASGIMYLGSPFVFYALQRWPIFKKYACPAGLAIITVALLASSFATTVTQLILTQGIFYAIGGSLFWSPVILFLDEWFIARKGFAYGIMWAGTGTSGVVVPLVMNWGLEKYGFRTMLRVWAIVLIVLAGPLLHYLKPRIPINTNSNATTRRPISFQFLKSPVFWMLQASNIIEGLGFFIPGIYLPSYARSLGLSSSAGSLTVVLFNATSIIGQVGLGYLVDKLHVTSVIMISTIGATLSVFFFWGFSMNLPLLIIFALFYGTFGGGFTSTYTGMSKEIMKTNPQSEIGTIFSVVAAGRGIGAVLSGPISELLLGQQSWKGDAALGYGTGYGPLIVFTGVTALCGGVSFLGKRLNLI